MSSTPQPVWKLVTNLGSDLDEEPPLKSVAVFVYQDVTGVYGPEMERCSPHTEATYEIHRVLLEKCTDVDGVLSDNKFHPEHPAWFADGLDDVADSTDYEGADSTGDCLADLRRDFCSEDPVVLARAYCAVYDYHGWDNGDETPRILSHVQARERYTVRHPA